MFFILHSFANDVTGKKKKKKKKEFQIREEFIQKKLFLYENSLFKSITPFLFNCVFVLRPLLFSSRRARHELHAKKLRWIYILPGLHLPAQS